MDRIERYYVNGREVSFEKWNELFNDKDNLKELTIKYEKALSYEELLEEVKSLKEKNEHLRRELDMARHLNEITRTIDSPWTTSGPKTDEPWKSPWSTEPYKYPTITFGDADWTVRRENLPTYNTTSTSQSDCILS